MKHGGILHQGVPAAKRWRNEGNNVKRILLTICALLAGCTATPIKTSKVAFLSGRAPAGISHSEIKKDLTRSHVGLGEGYAIEATLYTAPLIDVEQREQGKREMNSDQEVEKAIRQNSALLLDKKTCFLFTLEGPDIKTPDFKGFAAKLEDSKGKLHELKFSNLRGVASVPSFKGVQSWDVYKWWNISLGCTATPIDASQGFKVHFIPKYADRKKAVLVWNAQESVAAAPTP